MQDFIALGTAIRIILHTDSEFVYHPEESLLLRSIAGIFNPRPLGLSIHGSMAFIEMVGDSPKVTEAIDDVFLSSRYRQRIQAGDEGNSLNQVLSATIER